MIDTSPDQNLNYKLVKTGKILEFYIAQKNFTKTDDEKLLSNVHKYIIHANSDIEPKQLPKEYETTDRSEEYRHRSAYRAQNNIRRLVQTNFSSQSRFITLTFNNYQDFDIFDPKVTYQVLKLFLRRLEYKYPGFKYLVVHEFQKRGAVHYHMICDIPYIPAKMLENLWGHGFVKVNKISNPAKVGVYISKYLTKDAYLNKFDRVRKYSYSGNLKTPTTIYGTKAKLLLQKLISYTPQFSCQYPTEWHGIITYHEYNFYSQTKGGEEP